jgi:phosphatidylserine decarboxylase
MRKKLFISLQHCLPQHALSRLAGKLCNSTQTQWKNAAINHFVKAYQVDMSTALEPNPLAYPTFNDFFTRHLKPEARPIADCHNSIVSPADGTISQIGKIAAGRIFQAKGFDFSVLELLGGNAALAETFAQGEFATIYLAPRDYHRVHMPLTGTLRSMTYIPGKLFSVNTTTAESIPRLFARNERVVCVFDTDIGPMAVILVGAFFVASINTVWAGTVAPHTHMQITTTTYQPGEVRLAKGAEMGHFKLGSTAIVLFPEKTMCWDSALHANSPVMMGQGMGSITG